MGGVGGGGTGGNGCKRWPGANARLPGAMAENEDTEKAAAWVVAAATFIVAASRAGRFCQGPLQLVETAAAGAAGGNGDQPD